MQQQSPACLFVQIASFALNKWQVYETATARLVTLPATTMKLKQFQPMVSFIYCINVCACMCLTLCFYIRFHSNYTKYSKDRKVVGIIRLCGNTCCWRWWRRCCSCNGCQLSAKISCEWRVSELKLKVYQQLMHTYTHMHIRALRESPTRSVSARKNNKNHNKCM